MSKRIVFTTISPLPADIGREAVIDFFHNHEGMIDLNPLVVERHPLSAPPPHCPEDERHCVWWSMTDKISYMPGVKSDLTYTAAFQDLRDGIMTHCYAPMGTHIIERWSLGGTLPGEPKQPVELGLGAPSQGLYVREDVEVQCNFLMAGFVKKTILKAHGVLCERLIGQARAAPKAIAAVISRPPILSPLSTVFQDAHSTNSSISPISMYDARRRSYVGGALDASTPPSRKYSPPAQVYQHPPRHPLDQHQQGSGGLRPIHGHQRAVSSESGMTPESLRAWHAQQRKPYVHDPYNPYTQQQAPQAPPSNALGIGSSAGLGGWYSGQPGHQHGTPVAELSGSETHIAELQ